MEIVREKPSPQFVVFADAIRIAAGTLAESALAARRALDFSAAASVLVVDADTGGVVDLDLRGTEEAIVERHRSAPIPDAIKRGRPKLGVVAREVTLLPRHWEWLAQQKGGASATLRTLVEAARKAGLASEPVKARRDAAYRFMSTMAGDLPGFEEAVRALFAGDLGRLEEHATSWPRDVRDEALRFARGREAA